MWGVGERVIFQISFIFILVAVALTGFKQPHLHTLAFLESKVYTFQDQFSPSYQSPLFFLNTLNIFDIHLLLHFTVQEVYFRF